MKKFPFVRTRFTFITQSAEKQKTVAPLMKNAFNQFIDQYVRRVVRIAFIVNESMSDGNCSQPKYLYLFIGIEER